MKNRKWIISTFGHAQDKINLASSVYHWDIEMRVTSEKSEESEHFHTAWAGIFKKMHRELGSQFCNIYGSRIRSDIFRAISSVTNPYFCVEHAEGGFSIDSVDCTPKFYDPEDHLKMHVRVTEYTCEICITEPSNSK